MPLSREQFLSAAVLPIEEVDVPALGGKVRVRGLTLAQRDEYEASVIDSRGKRISLNRENLRAKLIVRCVIDANGDRLFKDEDAPAVGHLPAAALEPLFEASQRLSGLSPSDVEDLAGNSERGQPGS